jgi:uncharacterized protein (TIGR02996 family)
MADHDAFVRMILEAPHKQGPRLVYADWLDEQGDPASTDQAEFLRIECQLDALPARDRRRTKLMARLRQLREVIQEDWWRLLDWPPVELCVTFAFECPQRWDTLRPTEDPGVRRCDMCSQNVYYCRNQKEAQARAELGHCVAIDSRIPRLRGDLDPVDGGRRLLGRVLPKPRRRIPLSERKSLTTRPPEALG